MTVASQRSAERVRQWAPTARSATTFTQCDDVHWQCTHDDRAPRRGPARAYSAVLAAPWCNAAGAACAYSKYVCRAWCEARPGPHRRTLGRFAGSRDPPWADSIPWD